MHLPVAVAQFRPVKADPDATLERVRGVLEEVCEAERRPELVLFPETALTGYFLEGGVRDHALRAEEVAVALQECWTEVGDGAPIDVCLGFYERHRDRVYNAGLYVELGPDGSRIRDVHRKVFLPTYGVFQEDRYVEAGSVFRAFDTRWGRAAVLVCEDAWHSLSATLAALDGAQLILVPSAAPARGIRPGRGVPATVDRWERLVRGIAEEHGVYVVLAQLSGFEGGKGFAGGSTIVDPRGRTLVSAPLWEESLVSATLDLDALLEARTQAPLLADLEAALPRILRGSPAFERTPEGEASARPGPAGRVVGRIEGGEEGEAPGPRLVAPDGERPARTEEGPPPSDERLDPSDRSVLEIDPELVETWLVEFLRQEMRERRGFERAIVGLSGGADSSLTALLCARAFGGENVHGFLLPSEVSSDESREHALRVAEVGGLETREIEIAGAVSAYLDEHEPDASAVRRGNVMARQRMIVLFDQAKKLGGLPVGTGNKSERLLGYFTWHADDAPPINPIGDLFKTQVWQLARHVGVPEEIVEKPATAELVADQTDEGELGLTYPEADLILHHFLEGHGPEELVAAGFDERKVATVRDRLAGSHFKRHLPTVAMLSDTAINEWYLRPVDY